MGRGFESLSAHFKSPCSYRWTPLEMNALDLLYMPVALLSAPLWARKKRGGWSQRVGKIEPMLSGRWGTESKDKSNPVVMLHAVSVGEVNALRALVPLLIDDATIVISTTTDTGLKRAQTLFSETCEVVRYPLDCSWMVDRFLDTINPDVVGLVELEVWPNFVKACSKRKIPIGIINGRLSARSFKGYKKIKPLLRKTFARLGFVCMQDQSYANRVEALGANNVRVTGSMKWDALDVSGPLPNPSEDAIILAEEMGLDLSKPIIVAGSTGPGEEAMLHRVSTAGAQLVCAPRKPERFEEAALSMPGCTRRSTQEPRENTRFLLDTIGELSTMYQLADLVVIGRSFFNLHGSDPLEAAALGKAVLIGPQNSDFTTQIEALLESDAIEVVDASELAARLDFWLFDPEKRMQMGLQARECVAQHQGASKVHAELLLNQIKC
jgi:3-deoxy-D-manno-octulosonic-acid transferase